MNAFVIHPGDNVATALGDIPPGAVRLFGEGDLPPITAIENVRAGHKIALTDIPAGQPVTKYGETIGTASQAITAGQWVHLHNLKSNFDERSGSLDPDTRAPIEEEVYQ